MYLWAKKKSEPGVPELILYLFAKFPASEKAKKRMDKTDATLNSWGIFGRMVRMPRHSQRKPRFC